MSMHMGMHDGPLNGRHRWLTGGIITVVPMNAEAAKKMGEDLIKKQGGPMLAKLTGTHMLCLCERLRVCAWVGCMQTDVCTGM